MSRSSRVAALATVSFVVITLAGLLAVPARAAAVVECSVDGSLLEVAVAGHSGFPTAFELDGDSLDVASGECTYDLGDEGITRLSITGTEDDEEYVLFYDAGSTEEDWSQLSIAIDLRDGDDPELEDWVYFFGTEDADVLDASTFATYVGVEWTYIWTFAGDDTIHGANGARNEFEDDEGQDIVYGGDLGDILYPEADDDADEMHGLGGDDVFYDRSDGGKAGDLLDGGAGSDTADYQTRGHAVHVVLGAAGALTSDNGESGEHDRIMAVENVIGTQHDDTIVGNDRGNRLDPGSDGEDEVIGGGGNDTIDYDHQTYESVTVDLDDDGEQTSVSSDGDVDLISGFENVRGGYGADTIEGDDGPNVLEGGVGADTVSGMGGSDLFLEGSDDIGYIGASEDTIEGGSGRDTLDYSGRPYAEDEEGVTVDLADDACSGGGEDCLPELDVEDVVGSPGEDDISGNSLVNRLAGGAGDDLLDGWSGADQLRGGTGDDVMDGRDGRDLLVGGPGADRLFGGDGDDRLDGTRDGDTDLSIYGGAGSDLCRIESADEGLNTNSCERISPRKYAPLV